MNSPRGPASRPATGSGSGRTYPGRSCVSRGHSPGRRPGAISWRRTSASPRRSSRHFRFPLYQLGSDVVATLFTVRLASIASVSTSLNASLLGGIGIIGLGNTPSDMTDPMVPAFTAGASLGFAFGDFGISLDLRDHVAIARAYTWRAVDNYLDVGLSCTFGFGATP